MGGNSFRTVIRLIAGGYICYLGYQLINGYIHPTEETGDPVWFMMLFGILFIAVGVFLIIDVIRKAGAKEEETEEEAEGQENTEGTQEKELPDKDEDDKAEAPAAGGYPQTMTIAERIRRLSEENDDSEDEPEPQESGESKSDDQIADDNETK